MESINFSIVCGTNEPPFDFYAVILNIIHSLNPIHVNFYIIIPPTPQFNNVNSTLIKYLRKFDLENYKLIFAVIPVNFYQKHNTIEIDKTHNWVSHI
jgi:hypothetical protein